MPALSAETSGQKGRMVDELIAALIESETCDSQAAALLMFKSEMYARGRLVSDQDLDKVKAAWDQSDRVDQFVFEFHRDAP